MYEGIDSSLQLSGDARVSVLRQRGLREKYIKKEKMQEQQGGEIDEGPRPSGNQSRVCMCICHPIISSVKKYAAVSCHITIHPVSFGPFALVLNETRAAS